MTARRRVLCGAGLILLLSACVRPEPPPAAPPPRVCAKPEQEGSMLTFAPPLTPERAITVAAVGDVLLHEPLQRYAAGQPDGVAALLAPVADLLQAADVTFGNLEGPAAANLYNTGREAEPPPSGRFDGRVYSGYPMFNYHPAAVAELKASGFDVMTLANNHALDRQALGVDRTLEAFAAAGLSHTGTRHRDAPAAPWYAVTSTRLADQDYRIAWLGCTYGTNEIPDPYAQVLRCFDQQDEVLATLRQLAADPTIAATILAPHWGREYRHDPTDRQRALAQAAVEAGATAVIGAHPHVLQPMEVLRAADGREALVAYSLGNFVSGQASLARRSGVILLMALVPQADGKLALAEARFVPVETRRQGEAYRVVASDRDPGDGKSRAHVLSRLPPGNLHPATLPFWSAAACAGAAGS